MKGIRRSNNFSQDKARYGNPLFLRALVLGAACLALASCTPRGHRPTNAAVRTAPSDPVARVAASTSAPGSAGQRPAGSTEDSRPPVVRLLVYGRDGYRDVQRASLIDAHWSRASKAYQDGLPITWPDSASVQSKRGLIVVFHTSRRPEEIGVRVYGGVEANGEPGGAPLVDERVAGATLSPCESNKFCLELPLKGIGPRFISLSGVWYIPTFDKSAADPGPKSAAWLLRIELTG